MVLKAVEQSKSVWFATFNFCVRGGGRCLEALLSDIIVICCLSDILFLNFYKYFCL